MVHAKNKNEDSVINRLAIKYIHTNILNHTSKQSKMIGQDQNQSETYMEELTKKHFCSKK